MELMAELIKDGDSPDLRVRITDVQIKHKEVKERVRALGKAQEGPADKLIFGSGDTIGAAAENIRDAEVNFMRPDFEKLCSEDPELAKWCMPGDIDFAKMVDEIKRAYDTIKKSGDKTVN